MSVWSRLAIVADSAAPYRIHLHRRIAREIPGIHLHSVFTHEGGSSDWAVEDAAEIGAVQFGRGESGSTQSSPRYASREWFKGGEIAKWLSEHRIEVVIVCGYADAGRVRLIHHCREAGIPCYLFGDSNIRGDSSRGLTGYVKSFVVSRILRQCTGVLCCGRLGREYFERYGATPTSIHLFPYEPDYQLFEQPSGAMIASIRQELRLVPGRRRLMYSGRMVSEKRVDLLLHSFRRIAATRPNFDLILSGTGPLLSALQHSVPSDLAGRVRFVGFTKEQTRLAALYHCADVLVLPSDFEPWGVVVTEAAAAGMALVCSSAVGSAAEVVVDGVNGRVFERGDVEGLSRCLLDVTETRTLFRMRACSNRVLQEWRSRSDPVETARRLLGHRSESGH